jgi:hypothetical protein
VERHDRRWRWVSAAAPWAHLTRDGVERATERGGSGFSAQTQHGSHEESYLGFGGREEAVPRARSDGATSLIWDIGSGLPRRSPDSQFRSYGSASRSSSSSYAPIVVRSYESHMHGEIMMLGF